MCFRFPRTFLTAAIGVGLACSLPPSSFAQSATSVHEKTLTFCADPHNLPFSNSKEQGFENRIAAIVAADLHARAIYTWQRMDRGFVREYLNKSACQVLTGVPNRYPHVLTTEPYYRSTYVFVYRHNAAAKPDSLNDPALRKLKIGVQAVGEEYTPPGEALARRGMQAAIVPFHTNGGDESEILDAVASRRIDGAIIWGPEAGYFAQKYGKTLELVPVTPQMDPPGVPFTFAISMGVKKGNEILRDQIDAALERHESEIRKILKSYGVPQIDLAAHGEASR